MKIEDKVKKGIFFNELEEGDAFIDVHGDIYMATEPIDCSWGTANAVNLADGAVTNFQKTERVFRIECKLVAE